MELRVRLVNELLFALVPLSGATIVGALEHKFWDSAESRIISLVVNDLVEVGILLF